MHISRFRRSCVMLVSASLVSLGLQAPAVAGIVGTAEAVAAAREQGDRAAVAAAMARADVRAQLLALGVDPAAVDGRLAALTAPELATLAGQLEQAPAGGDSALAIVGLVFLVLLLLEYTGTIDIFKKVP
jgi:hypothetical protein